MKSIQVLLTKAKYNKEEIEPLIKISLLKNYYVQERFYMRPESIVQRVNELGLDDIEYFL